MKNNYTSTLKSFSILTISTICFFANFGNCKAQCHKGKETIIETDYVSISIDTIYLQTDKEFFDGILSDDRFYLYGNNVLFTFDKCGNMLGTPTPLPKNMDNHWKIRYLATKDSLIAIDTREETKTYFLDKKKNSWIPTDNVQAFIYEDDSFRVLKTDNGEWGGMVYFIDKKNDKIYRGYSNSAQNINKIGNKYYVTNFLAHLIFSASIYEIEDPTKMEEYKGSVKDIIENRADKSEKERYVFEGIKKVVSAYRISISSSFLHKGRFLQMYSNFDRSSQKTYIAEIVNEKLENKYMLPLGDAWITYLYTLDDKYIFRFRDSDSHLHGVIEISDDKIRIHILKSKYSYSPE